jgi:very-short-patch-repair endonuclease
MSSYRYPPVSPLPGRQANELDWLEFEQSGVLTSAQAAEHLGRAGLRRRVDRGQWRRICSGIVLTHNGPLTAGQVLWVAVLLAGPTSLLAGLTAAREGGLRFVGSGPVQVLVPGDRQYPDLRRRLPLDMPAVVVRRTNVLPEEHRQLGRPMRTSMARSLVDAAGWARSDDEAQAIIAAGCQQRRVTPEEILAALHWLPRVRRRQLVHATAVDAGGGATALSEIDFVRLCRHHGLPLPELQQRRRDRSGRVRYLDAYWRRWRLHVEVDGSHHMDVREWAADMRRQNDVWIAGDRILRFPAFVVRARPTEVVDQLRAALRAAGWPS